MRLLPRVAFRGIVVSSGRGAREAALRKKEANGMKLTVERALKFEGMNKCTLVAGKNGVQS